MAAFLGGSRVALRPPNRSVNTDAPGAALRARAGSPVTFDWKAPEKSSWNDNLARLIE
jgi:hypothetical protein